MAEHETCIGQSDDWYTPPEIFKALGIQFDLDPCSPGVGHWVPANNIFTKEDDGLNQEWKGCVFMNPPFGGRNGHVPWLEKFLKHGDGIAIVRAYTSSGWFHQIVAPQAETLLFPKGKTKFVRPDGSIGKSPGHGIVLIGMGDKAMRALQSSDLGWFVINVTALASGNRTPCQDSCNDGKVDCHDPGTNEEWTEDCKACGDKT